MRPWPPPPRDSRLAPSAGLQSDRPSLLAALPGVAVLLAIGLPALLLPRSLSALYERAAGGRTLSAAVLVGLVAGLLTHWFLRHRESYRFLAVLQHELAHLFVGLLLFSVPLRLTSERDSGAVQYRIPGPLAASRHLVISTAPYWFSPLLLLPVAACLLPAPPGSFTRSFLALLAGLAMALAATQIHPRQPDLRQYGFLPATALALWSWLGLATAVLRLLETWSFGAAGRTWTGGWKLLVAIVAGL